MSKALRPVAEDAHREVGDARVVHVHRERAEDVPDRVRAAAEVVERVREAVVELVRVALGPAVDVEDEPDAVRAERAEGVPWWREEEIKLV